VLARQLATDRLGALRRAQRGVGLRGKQASSGDLALAKRQARSGLTLRGVDGAAASERSSMGAIGESTDAPAPPPTTTTQPPSGGGADGRPSTTGARARGAPGTPPARSWSPAASPASTHEQPRAASPFGAHHAAALDETTRAARGGAKFVGTLAAGSGSYVGKLFDGDGGEREQPGARHRARPRRASDSSASSDDDDAPVADGARGAAAAAGGGVGAFDASTFDLALDLPKVLKRFVKTLARCLALEAHAAAIDAEAARARESAERETAERALAEARASELQQRVLALEVRARARLRGGARGLRAPLAAMRTRRCAAAVVLARSRGARALAAALSVISRRGPVRRLLPRPLFPLPRLPMCSRTLRRSCST
jgi:hypothetical protein